MPISAVSVPSFRSISRVCVSYYNQYCYTKTYTQTNTHRNRIAASQTQKAELQLIPTTLQLRAPARSCVIGRTGKPIVIGHKHDVTHADKHTGRIYAGAPGGCHRIRHAAPRRVCARSSFHARRNTRVHGRNEQRAQSFASRAATRYVCVICGASAATGVCRLLAAADICGLICMNAIYLYGVCSVCVCQRRYTDTHVCTFTRQAAAAAAAIIIKPSE